MSDHTLPRQERLRSLKVIRRLFEEGRSGFVYPFRYIWLKEESAENVEVAAGEGASVVVAEGSAGTVLASSTSGEGAGVVASVGSNGVAGGVEVMFSVPKKFHKRANKRNLLKRRTREAYRQSKGRKQLSEKVGQRARNIDLALVYSTKEELSYKTISNAVQRILEQVCSSI